MAKFVKVEDKKTTLFMFEIGNREDATIYMDITAPVRDAMKDDAKDKRVNYPDGIGPRAAHEIAKAQVYAEYVESCNPGDDHYMFSTKDYLVSANPKVKQNVRTDVSPG